MRLFVLGATGGIGRLLLKYGLQRGHEITAFVRSPSKVVLNDNRLTVVKGDLFDVDAVEGAMRNHDVVLSAFGPATLASTDLRRKFGHILAAAAEKSGVKRVLVVSSGLLFDNVGLLGNVLKSTLFRKMLPDMANMEGELMRDSLEWTIVRPPRLIDGALTSNYVIQEGRLPEGRRAITRANVAEFMLNEAERKEHVKAIVGLA